jgi:hypothetical protein
VDGIVATGKFWWRFFGAIGAFLLIAWLVLPRPEVNRESFANEALAVSKLRTIGELQNNYLKSHPSEGFACRLPLLRPAGPLKLFDPDTYLRTGERSGYRFELECHGDPNGVVTHYEVSAVPDKPGSTGVRAFCTDQSGVIWYDMDGSREKCLAARKPLM